MRSSVAQVFAFAMAAMDESNRRESLNFLGLTESATEADIRKRYKELARKYHPDKNPDDPNATKKFQQLTVAFTTLMEWNEEEKNIINQDEDLIDLLSFSVFMFMHRARSFFDFGYTHQYEEEEDEEDYVHEPSYDYRPYYDCRPYAPHRPNFSSSDSREELFSFLKSQIPSNSRYARENKKGPLPSKKYLRKVQKRQQYQDQAPPCPKPVPRQTSVPREPEPTRRSRSNSDKESKESSPCSSQKETATKKETREKKEPEPKKIEPQKPKKMTKEERQAEQQRKNQEHNEIVAQLKEQKKKEEEREQRKAEKEQRLREELDRQPVTAAAGLAYSAATKKKSKKKPKKPKIKVVTYANQSKSHSNQNPAPVSSLPTTSASVTSHTTKPRPVYRDVPDDWCRESPSDQSASSFRSGSHALRNNDWDAASHQSIDRSGRSSYQFMDESRNRRDSFGSQSASWGAVCGSMAAQSNNPVTVPRSRGAQAPWPSASQESVPFRPSPAPSSNIWRERHEFYTSALPANEQEEDKMLQAALELSRLEAGGITPETYEPELSSVSVGRPAELYPQGGPGEMAMRMEDPTKASAAYNGYSADAYNLSLDEEDLEPPNMPEAREQMLAGKQNIAPSQASSVMSRGPEQPTLSNLLAFSSKLRSGQPAPTQSDSLSQGLLNGIKAIHLQSPVVSSAVDRNEVLAAASAAAAATSPARSRTESGYTESPSEHSTPSPMKMESADNVFTQTTPNRGGLDSDSEESDSYDDVGWGSDDEDESEDPLGTPLENRSPAAPWSREKSSSPAPAAPWSEGNTASAAPAAPWSKRNTASAAPAAPWSKGNTASAAPAAPWSKGNTASAAPAAPWSKGNTASATPAASWSKENTSSATSATLPIRNTASVLTSQRSQGNAAAATQRPQEYAISGTGATNWPNENSPTSTARRSLDYAASTLAAAQSSQNHAISRENAGSIFAASHLSRRNTVSTPDATELPTASLASATAAASHLSLRNAPSPAAAAATAQQQKENLASATAPQFSHEDAAQATTASHAAPAGTPIAVPNLLYYPSNMTWDPRLMNLYLPYLQPQYHGMSFHQPMYVTNLQPQAWNMHGSTLADPAVLGQASASASQPAAAKSSDNPTAVMKPQAEPVGASHGGPPGLVKPPQADAGAAPDSLPRANMATTASNGPPPGSVRPPQAQAAASSQSQVSASNEIPWENPVTASVKPVLGSAKPQAPPAASFQSAAPLSSNQLSLSDSASSIWTLPSATTTSNPGNPLRSAPRAGAVPHPLTQWNASPVGQPLVLPESPGADEEEDESPEPIPKRRPPGLKNLEEEVLADVSRLKAAHQEKRGFQI